MMNLNFAENKITDLNRTHTPLSVWNSSRHISSSPVTQTVVAAPVTVEDGSITTRGRTRRGIIYGRDAQGKFLSKDGTQKKRSSSDQRRRRRKKRSSSLMTSSAGDDIIDMFMTLGGGDFRPHLLTVNTGEDIIERIMSFTANGSRGIIVLSANGLVANIKIQTLLRSREVVTFKDVYAIVSLKSSMEVWESGEVRTGEWRIMIGGADAALFGGVLVGSLTAASPVQVVVGSFLPLVTNPPERRVAESHPVAVAPVNPQSLASSSRQVQQQDVIGGRNDKSKAVMVAPPVPRSLDLSARGQVRQPDMVIGSSHSQNRSDGSQTVNFSARIPNSMAVSIMMVQVQQQDLRGPDLSHKKDDESQAASIAPRNPSELASSSTGQVAQPGLGSSILRLGWHSKK
ncbi:PREDICTED: AT-hook motif nuclear-localized protein 7-like [Camelina sativa]|uniref:AT-hook motif nuclear-localized protein n=1 Tax=Camelina sativa TaxID=90675 RepID=A0ABM0Z2E2_CAMSA|nr:PREDICTED: AT-hook motif nuclear-localized protein 7-like [Camelina sativa]